MRLSKIIWIMGLGLIWAVLSPSAVSGDESAHKTGVAGWLYEVRMGILAHDVDNLWSGTSVEPESLWRPANGRPWPPLWWRGSL